MLDSQQRAAALTFAPARRRIELAASAPSRGGRPLPPNKYNASGAAAWARANANSGGNPFPDDCTDFVSRAMHIGGGLPEVNTGILGIPGYNRADDSNGYMLWPAFHSYSWTSAPHLANFLRLTGWRQVVSLQAASPGDLIFVNWGYRGRDTPPYQTDTTGPGGIDHVGIVVSNPGGRGGYDILVGVEGIGPSVERLAVGHCHVRLPSVGESAEPGGWRTRLAIG